MLNRQVQCPNSQEECRVDYYSDQINKLIEEFSRLPGIGPKSAGRLAFHLIHMPKEQVRELADSMIEARRRCVTASAVIP